MSLRRILVDLANAIADEMEQNQALAERITRIISSEGQRSGAVVDRGNAVRRNRRPPARIDPLESARIGETELRARLSSLSVDELKDVIAQYGMDPSKLAMKWKTSEKLIERIVEVSMSRAQKGDAFR